MKHIFALVVLALPLVVFAEDKPLTRKQFDKQLITMYPTVENFESAAEVKRCVDQATEQYLRARGLSANHLTPSITVDYKEAFHDYGGHFFTTFETGNTKFTVNMTARKEVRYHFVKKGEAIRATRTAAYVFVQPPGMSKDEDRVSCLAGSVPKIETVSEYPRCLDPADDCPDLDN